MDVIDTIELDDKKSIDEVNNTLNDIEDFMKKESLNRKNLINEANENLDMHSKRLVEYNQIAKDYEVVLNKYKKLYMKYQTLESETRKIIKQHGKIDDELINIKRENVNLNQQNATLKSILNIIEEKVGIDMLSRATGISAKKIKEYLR